MNEKVREVRKSLHMSQKQFAEKLGITGAGVSKIESGDRNLTPQMILLICQQFGVNSQWLKTGLGDMFTTDGGESKLLTEALEIFKTLRPEFQDYALDQIKKLAELQEKV